MGWKSKLVDIVEKKINREILEEEIKRASTGSVKQTKKKIVQNVCRREEQVLKRERNVIYTKQREM